MPEITSWSDIDQVTEWEKRLRRNEWQAHPAILDKLPLDAYRHRIVMLFEIYRQIAHRCREGEVVRWSHGSV
jgi:hypothetical protein